MSPLVRRVPWLFAAALAAASAGEPPRRPWEPSYKIRPEDKHRLTAADVVGPDGIVYPDWRPAGLPGGIPAVADCARIEEFGGKADDEADDSAAFEKGVAAVAQRGGGALVLGKGVYHLDRPVLVASDGIVIRGQGAEATKIVFRYGGPDGGVGFFRPHDGATLGRREADDQPTVLREISRQRPDHRLQVRHSSPMRPDDRGCGLTLQIRFAAFQRVTPQRPECGREAHDWVWKLEWGVFVHHRVDSFGPVFRLGPCGRRPRRPHRQQSREQ